MIFYLLFLIVRDQNGASYVYFSVTLMSDMILTNSVATLSYQGKVTLLLLRTLTL